MVIKLEVDKKGMPQQVETARDSRNKCVDKAAVAAVRNYRFTPAQHDGSPASVHIALAVETGELASHDEKYAAFAALNPTLPGVIPPVLVQSEVPQLPLNASQGSVTLKLSLSVEPNGIPSNVHVVSSSNSDFDPIVVAAIKQYRFWPAIQNGQPVKVDMELEYNLMKTVSIN